VNNKIFNAGIIFLLCIIITFSTSAADRITLTDAFLTALNNNIELKEKANEIRNLERDLEIIRAQQSWNIEVNGEYSENLSKADNISLRTTNNNIDEGGNAAVNIEKEFTSGLIVNQEFSYNNNSEENYYIFFKKPLLPFTESSLEKEYFQKSRELLKIEAEYVDLKEEKIIDWVDNYLSILRLEKTLSNLERSLEKALDYLETENKKAALGEAGKSEVIAAEIAYLDVKIEYFEINNKFLNAKKSFVLNLGLEKEQNIIYDQNIDFLNFLRNNLINYDQNNIENLYDELLNNDIDLKIQNLNLIISEKNLDWVEDDAKISLDLNGSYDQSTEESILALSLSYDIYDGGVDKLRQKKIADDIEIQKEKLSFIKENKFLELENLINNIKLSDKNLKKAQLSLQKAELELNISKEQLSDGSSAENKVLESEINYYSSLNEYYKYQDQLFIEELKLSKVINDKIVDTENWRGEVE
jgi:hypothetical protein